MLMYVYNNGLYTYKLVVAERYIAIYLEPIQIQEKKKKEKDDGKLGIIEKEKSKVSCIIIYQVSKSTFLIVFKQLL